LGYTKLELKRKNSFQQISQTLGFWIQCPEQKTNQLIWPIGWYQIGFAGKNLLQPKNPSTSSSSSSTTQN
jgi:hypothetical protein